MHTAETFQYSSWIQRAVQSVKNSSSGESVMTPADSKQIGGNHYKTMKIQPWAALEAWLTPEQLRGYFLGSAIAYLARMNVGSVHGKGGLQDLEKAKHYLEKLIETEKGNVVEIPARYACGCDMNEAYPTCHIHGPFMGTRFTPEVEVRR